jgi:hypothetical protein
MRVSRGDFPDDDDISLAAQMTFHVHLRSPSPPPAGNPLWLCMGQDIMEAIWFPERHRPCIWCRARVEGIIRSDGGMLAAVHCTHMLCASPLRCHRWPEHSPFGEWYAQSGQRLGSDI